MDSDKFGTQAARDGSGGADHTTAARVLPLHGRHDHRLTQSEQFVHVAGRRLLVRRSGTGAPLLLLPGMGMPLTTWGPLLARLPGFECIAVALPGNGGFPGAHPVLTMPGFAALVRGLLDQLDIPTADVLGLSFGGLVAQQLAHDAPDRVRGLVLVATSCGLGGIPDNPVNWWAAVLSGGWRESRRRLAEWWPWQLVRRIGIGWSTGPRLAGLAEQLTAASMWSSLPWLATLSQPTLVLAGTADAVVPDINASILAAVIPTAQLHRVRGGGHLCVFDRAGEVGPVIAEFLHSLQRAAGDEVVELG